MAEPSAATDYLRGRVELVRAIRALTVDVADGELPANPMEKAIGMLPAAIDPAAWKLERGYVGADEIRERLFAANAALRAHGKAMGKLLFDLQAAAAAYLGGDFNAPDAKLTHGSGFPGMGPPTLCGEQGTVAEPLGPITCPVCIGIHCEPGALAARMGLVAQHHAAQAPQRAR